MEAGQIAQESGVDKVFEPTAHSLAGIRIFAGLSDAERASIAQYCNGHRYPPDRNIICHTDETTDIYFLISGRVRATIYSLGGKEVAFRDLGSGTTFGDLSAIDGRPRCATVKTLDECAVLHMNGTAFWQVMMEHPKIAGEMLKEITALVRLLSERIVEFSTLDVKHRIHCELLRLADEALESGTRKVDAGMVEILRPPTHEAIANRITTHREAVTKELNRLIKKGLLKKRPGVLVVCDFDRLRQLATDENAD